MFLFIAPGVQKVKSRVNQKNIKINLLINKK